MTTNKKVMSLEEQALELTKKNTNFKNSNGFDKKEYFRKLLQSESLKRIEIVSKMSLEILKSEFKNVNLQDPKQVDKFVKINKTCKNSVDTIISNCNKDSYGITLEENSGNYSINK